MEINGSAVQELLSKVNILCEHFSSYDYHEALVSYTLNELLEIAAENKASSLYLNAGSPPELNIGGSLSIIESTPLTNADCRKLFRYLLTDSLLKELYKTGQAETFTSCSGSAFKAYMHLERGQICASFRRYTSSVPKLSELGLSGSATENALKSSSGLILLTGLPRSGKANTFASIVSYINSVKNCRIVTLESPIRFWHYNTLGTVLQREIGIDVPSFSEGIKQASRQEANVICIGTIPDKETLYAAVKAAASGRLVIAAADAYSSISCLDKVINALAQASDSGKLLNSFADSLNMVIYQNLLSRSDGRGLVPAFEILPAVKEIKAEIRSGKTENISLIMQQNKMQSMERAVLRLFNLGLISQQEAEKFADIKNLQTAIGDEEAGEYDSEPIDAKSLEENDTPLMSWL